MASDETPQELSPSSSLRANPFFSIIMPVYNTADFIAEAVASILAQTFTDWELLLIDDASPDDAMDIVAPYAETDDRIRIIHHEENEGLSGARNTGLDESRGMYVWFADSDDTFDPTLLACVRDEIEATDADVVLFGLRERYYDARGEHLYDNEVPLSRYSSSDPADWHKRVIALERDTHFGYSCTKVYRSSIIRQYGLSFQKIRLIEDFLFNIDFFEQARSIAILDGSFYNYRKIDGRSLTNANSYSAREYFDLHERRIQTMRDLLAGWNVLDEASRAILGSLYGRYILSALERTYHPDEDLTDAQRCAWFEDISSGDLFIELIEPARADGSKALALSLSALRSKNPRRVVRLARSINFVRRNLYPVFTRLRSGR